MRDFVSVVLPEQVDAEQAEVVQRELSGLREVEEAGSASTRSPTVAGLFIWVAFAVDAVTAGVAAASAIQKIVDRIRGRGILGAVIELPNGVTIKVDSARPEEIQKLAAAWKEEGPDEG